MNIHLKVKNGTNDPQYELWIDEEYLGNVSHVWVLEVIRQFAGALRWQK